MFVSTGPRLSLVSAKPGSELAAHAFGSIAKIESLQSTEGRQRIFLLSPANVGGQRARIVLSERANFELAVKLRNQGAPLGEIYAFISGLYFRGKLAYCRAFASPPSELPGSLIITPGRGLVQPETICGIEELRMTAGVPIGADSPKYREPLERDARILNESAGPDCQFILLGSLATSKYVEPLLKLFGGRLLFPTEFVGRSDMSRGGLMLRSAHSGQELHYARAETTTRHGPRPPKLPNWKPPSPDF